MLALSDVTPAYDQVPVLNGLNLELKRGEVLALLGRNGVGKTTLLRTIMGLLPRSSGSTRTLMAATNSAVGSFRR
jgi:ABC-type multidrug transport system ATPase subunit